MTSSFPTNLKSLTWFAVSSLCCWAKSSMCSPWTHSSSQRACFTPPSEIIQWKSKLSSCTILTSLICWFTIFPSTWTRFRTSLPRHYQFIKRSYLLIRSWWISTPFPRLSTAESQIKAWSIKRCGGSRTPEFSSLSSITMLYLGAMVNLWGLKTWSTSKSLIWWKDILIRRRAPAKLWPTSCCWFKITLPQERCSIQM